MKLRQEVSRVEVDEGSGGRTRERVKNLKFRLGRASSMYALASAMIKFRSVFSSFNVG